MPSEDVVAIGRGHPCEIDWVIVGGESYGGRPCDLDWVRSLVRQCGDAGVACFVKQLGSNPVPSTDADRHRITEFYPWGNSKWDDADWFPEDLRVRQMPEVARA